MADGFSRIKRGRQIGVFAAQHGPGIENAFPGVAQAYAENVPLMVLPAGMALAQHYKQPTFRSTEVFAPVTKATFTLSADEADTIAEVSSGALSIDRRERLLGVPSASVPIPLAGPFKTPEISFWKSKERTGVAKFRLTFYDAETGALQDASDPVYGFSHFDRSSILFFGSTDSNLMPPEVEERRESNAGTQD